MRPPYDPNAEVIGQVMYAYIDNLRADVILPLLEKNNLVNIQPDQWYKVKPWLDVIDELSTKPNFMQDMIAVGLKVAQYAVMPPEMANVTLGQMLEGWDVHFHANHRSGEIGHILTEKVNDKFYKTIHRHIYPDDLNYGLAYGFAHTMLPKGTPFKVWYEDIQHRLGNDNADQTVICIQWE